MKGKVFGVVIVLALVFAMMVSVSCSSSPTTPAATATSVGPGQTATAVAAAATATAAANIAATATAVAVANAAETGLYTFNSLNASQIGDWAAGNALSAKVWNTTIAAGNLGSTGCLQLTYAGTGTQTNSQGYIQYAYGWDNSANGGAGGPMEVNFTGKTVSCWIYVPPTSSMSTNYAINFNIQDNVYKNCTKWVTLGATGWVQASFDMTTPPDYSDAGWDITKVTQVQIQLMKTVDGSPDYSGPILFDTINW